MAEVRIMKRFLFRCTDCDFCGWGLNEDGILMSLCTKEDRFIDDIDPDKEGSFPKFCPFEIFDGVAS